MVSCKVKQSFSRLFFVLFFVKFFLYWDKDIETATKAVNQDTLDEYLARNNQALTELIEVHGVELRKLPDDVIEEFRVISNEILSDLAKEDEVISKVYDSYIEFKNNVSEYHKISEDSFIEARNK